MAEPPFDLAVLGSALLAPLLAGLLAGSHRKRVVLLCDQPVPLRLSRSFALSVAPLTRPRTWALLKRTAPETLKLVRGLGPGLHVRVDPLMTAASEVGREALGHIRHAAAGFGIPAERKGEAVLFRDAVLLRQGPLTGAMEPWLSRTGVVRPPRGATTTIRRDGTVRIDSGRNAIEAVQAILCDDAAIFTHLGPESDRLRVVQTTSILTAPALRLDTPVVFRLDSGLVAVQRRDGAIEAIGPDRSIGGLGQSTRLAARTSFRSLVTTDSAPLIGTVRNRVVLAGLGPTGAFLAPVLARFVAGAATDVERVWCLAHEPGKGRSAVADIGAPA